MLFIAWTLEVMLEMVRSFILWPREEGSLGRGGADSEAGWVVGVLVEAIAILKVGFE